MAAGIATLTLSRGSGLEEIFSAAGNVETRVKSKFMDFNTDKLKFVNAIAVRISPADANLSEMSLIIGHLDRITATNVGQLVTDTYSLKGGSEVIYLNDGGFTDRYMQFEITDTSVNQRWSIQEIEIFGEPVGVMGEL